MRFFQPLLVLTVRAAAAATAMTATAAATIMGVSRTSFTTSVAVE